MTRTTYTPSPTIDPRDDLQADHLLWEEILSTQLVRDGADVNGLFGVLHGFRCEGARLVLDGKRLRLDPGDEIGEEYPALRSLWLMPRRDELTRLLATVAERLNGRIAA